MSFQLNWFLPLCLDTFQINTQVIGREALWVKKWDGSGDTELILLPWFHQSQLLIFSTPDLLHSHQFYLSSLLLTFVAGHSLLPYTFCLDPTYSGIAGENRGCPAAQITAGSWAHWVEICEMLSAMETVQTPAQAWIRSTSNHNLDVWSIGPLRLAVLFRTTAHTWNIILVFTLLVWWKFFLLTKPFHPKLKPRLVQPSEPLMRRGCGNPQDQWVWILKHICVYVEEIWESIFWLMVSP